MHNNNNNIIINSVKMAIYCPYWFTVNMHKRVYLAGNLLFTASICFIAWGWKALLTSFSFFTASSHTCIPLDSSTSTRPRYCRKKKKKDRKGRKTVREGSKLMKSTFSIFHPLHLPHHYFPQRHLRRIVKK